MGEERLRRRIEHWTDHNDEHRARLEEAAREAQGLGLVEAAERLRLAAEATARVSDHLRDALRRLR